MTYENKYVVFDVNKGPKVIVDSLNTFGEDGWELASLITVAGEKIVAFLKRGPLGEPEPVDENAEKLAKLWGNGGKT